MRLRENKLKRLLESGGVALGIGVHELRDRGGIYVAAAAGADFVFIDLEHNPQSLETASDLIAHAHGAGITPVVRIPEIDYVWVTRVLDSGCQSLFVPHVKGPDDVARLFELAYYHPHGRRGMAMYGTAGVNYQQVTDVRELTEWQNDNLLLGLDLETKESLECLEDMLVPGIHWAIVGYQDLAQSYGIVGEYDDPLIADARSQVRDLCIERGLYYGGVPRDPSEFGAEVEAGAQIVLYLGILAFIRRAVAEADEELRRLGTTRSVDGGLGAPTT